MQKLKTLLLAGLLMSASTNQLKANDGGALRVLTGSTMALGALAKAACDREISNNKLICLGVGATIAAYGVYAGWEYSTANKNIKIDSGIPFAFSWGVALTTLGTILYLISSK